MLPAVDGIGESTIAIGIGVITRGVIEVSDGDGIGDIFSNGDGDVINGWIVVVIRFIDIRDVDGDGGRIGAEPSASLAETVRVLSRWLVIERFA